MYTYIYTHIACAQVDTDAVFFPFRLKYHLEHSLRPPVANMCEHIYIYIYIYIYICDMCIHVYIYIYIYIYI